MTMRRMVMTAGGAVLPVVAIALIFGNQWAVEAILGEGREGGLWPLLYWLQHPQWRLYPEGFYNWGYVISLDFGLLLFFVLLAGLVVAGVRAVDPNRGMLGAVVTGWWACVVASGLSSLVAGLLIGLTLDISPPGQSIVWNSVAGGAAFGFAYGWIAGLGALAGFHLGRDRGFGGQAPVQQGYAPQGYGQQPYQQQGAPMQPQLPPVPGQPPAPGQPVPGQQSYAPPQHPAHVPYVPPQGGPQQPVWGAAPQQPSVPQPFVPQQPSAPEQSAPEQPAPPPAPDAPTLDPPTQADDETVPAESGDAPASGGGDLADKTMLDHDPGAGDDRPMPPPA